MQLNRPARKQEDWIHASINLFYKKSGKELKNKLSREAVIWKSKHVIRKKLVNNQNLNKKVF